MPATDKNRSAHDEHSMKRGTATGIILAVSVVLFVFIVPVATTLWPVGSVRVPGQGCGGLSCGITGFRIVDQKCYETLAHYFLDLGGEVCYSANVTPQSGAATNFAFNSTQ
jgi:hypothetical protein